MAYIPKLSSDLDAAILRTKTAMDDAIDTAETPEQWKKAYLLRQDYLALIEARDQRLLDHTRSKMGDAEGKVIKGLGSD